MSDNWVVQNLENALETWNEKLSEIWTLITTTPQNFKGGNIWKVIVDINGAVQAIGLALLVLFFVIGMVKTCGSFTDVKKPEHALKLFVRFALAKGVITYGMELMLGTALTVEWNGVPASYLGVLTNAGILKADLFRNLQVAWMVQTGLSQMENGKTALMNQRQEILSSLIGKATVQQTTLVS